MPYADTKEDRLFFSHIMDLILAVDKHGSVRFSNFLGLHQISLAQNALASQKCRSYLLFGGHDAPERRILGIFPDEDCMFTELFPIETVCVSYPRDAEIAHKDILGSLLGLGIKRDCIGDILVGEGYSIFFVADSVCDFIMNELSKIGRFNVSLTKGVPQRPFPSLAEYEDIGITVSAMRLDAVVAALSRLSRDKAAKLVLSGGVSVDGKPILNINYQLTAERIVSIRRYGKYLIGGQQGVTKKGRLHLICKKYV